MLVAVLVFCPNYAQIMLAFQNYATFLKGIAKDRCASDTQVLISRAAHSGGAGGAVAPARKTIFFF